MSITISTISALIIHNAPSWLVALRDTLLDKSREVAIDKSKEFVVAKGSGLIRHIFQLDEKEQIRHLEQALRNATERGLARFTSLTDRGQYKDILYTLMQRGSHCEELRKEAL